VNTHCNEERAQAFLKLKLSILKKERIFLLAMFKKTWKIHLNFIQYSCEEVSYSFLPSIGRNWVTDDE